MGVGELRLPTVTLHHLEPGTLFRDHDALWCVEDGGNSDNILATRIAAWNVNNMDELRFVERGSENYNAYTTVRLHNGIYQVVR